MNADRAPLLSVIIPHFNEKDSIRELLKRVMAVPVRKELILVDDASTDGSREMIKNEIAGRFPDLKVVYHGKNLGKGFAIRSGLKHASGDILIIQDADLEYDPQDYLRILNAFEQPGVDVVYGTRFKRGESWRFFKHWAGNKFLGKKHPIKRFSHFFGIQVLNALANGLYRAHITDEATCYKAFRREVFQRIHLDCSGFEFCPEVTAKLRKAGYSITEVPVSYVPRTQKQGKKLNWRHGAQAIYTLIKYRFVD